MTAFDYYLGDPLLVALGPFHKILRLVVQCDGELVAQ